MNKKGFTVLGLLFVLAVFALVVIEVLSIIGLAMPNEGSAKHAIEAQGFRDVRDVDRHWFGSHYIHGCAEDDGLAFTASAVNANNQRVDVVACTGYFFKGFTLRTR